MWLTWWTMYYFENNNFSIVLLLFNERYRLQNIKECKQGLNFTRPLMHQVCPNHFAQSNENENRVKFLPDSCTWFMSALEYVHLNVLSFASHLSNSIIMRSHGSLYLCIRFSTTKGACANLNTYFGRFGKAVLSKVNRKCSETDHVNHFVDVLTILWRGRLQDRTYHQHT